MECLNCASKYLRKYIKKRENNIKRNKPIPAVILIELLTSKYMT